jgi:diguanylate cyclase (GGDEF)-like protein
MSSTEPGPITIWSKSLPRRLLHAILFGCLLASFGPKCAQAQFTRFENYTDEQGLGNASVSALAQDADGYILLGTEAGLYRYDGSTISPYGATAGLSPAAWIRKLVTDDRGRIWVVTTDGIYLRDGSSFSRIDVGKPLNLVSPHLIAFSEDNVIVDSGGTLLRAPLNTHAPGPFSPLLSPATSAANPELNRSRFVVSDSDGALLVGCGAAICRLKNGQVSMFGLADGLPADDWQVALRTPDGTMWARSLDRLAWRRPGQSSFSAVAIPGRRGQFNIAVPARLDLLANGHDGIFTMGEEGLLEYDGNSWRSFLHHDGGLSASPIQSFMFDREGSLWVGSVGHGAFRSLGLGTWEHWTASDGLPSNIVWAMTRLRNGQFWVATYGDTVPLDGRTSGVPGGSENVSATRAGRLWLAPLRAPLVRVDPAQGITEQFPITGTVSSTYVDPENRLWLSTDKALLTIADADAPAAEVKAEIVIPQSTAQVMTDLSGVTWAATTTGIARRSPSGQFQTVVPSVSLKGQPGGLAFAPDGDLWTFTDGAGVLRFHVTNHHVTSLPSITVPLIGSNNIMFLHRDRRNWMWIGTDHGIDLFDGRSWRRFDITDGLLSSDLDQWAVFEDADASMWFGSSRGLTHLVDPARLPPIVPLHPKITGLSIGTRFLSPSPLIRIDWSSAPLVIHFVDLDPARAKNITFRYRMRGLDTGWSDTVAHEVRYAGLPAGTLDFELVTVDQAHGSMSAPVGFTLRIRAPWWRHWWFYSSCALALAGAVAGTWQMRVRLLLRQRRLLERLVRERTAEIEQARSELERLAMSDMLTDLPNRRALMILLEKAVATSLSSQAQLAVLLFDIDHFKKINDGYGHLAGDAVLAEFGRRLSAAIEPPEAAGRYGGEEFCIVLPVPRKKVLERVAIIRLAIANSPYGVGNTSRTVTSSGGLAFLRAGESALSLLARADAALYRAKERGRDRIEHELLEEAAHALGGTKSEGLGRSQSEESNVKRVEYGLSGAGSNSLSQGRNDLEHDLREALTDGQFLLNYQPVVDLDRDVVTSCEALIRWHSPTRGKVSPADFIPFAEEVGLMPEIGDWVLNTACREAATWPDNMKVAVNLSAVQFRLPDLVARVEAALAATGLSPDRLELEVTETAMIGEMEAAICVLQQLRALGITVALDDFGTGYSSLSFLRTLPFDRIKIDRSFVQDLGMRPEATVIVRAIAGMCASLGASVTAEGVETNEQMEALRAVGCSEVQGYWIGRPCSATDLEAWLAAFAASHTTEVGVSLTSH